MPNAATQAVESELAELRETVVRLKLDESDHRGARREEIREQIKLTYRRIRAINAGLAGSAQVSP